MVVDSLCELCYNDADWRLAMKKEDIGFTLNALVVLVGGAIAVAITVYVFIANFRVAFGLY